MVNPSALLLRRSVANLQDPHALSHIEIAPRYQTCGQPQEINASGPQALGRLSFQGGCKCAATGWTRALRWWWRGASREWSRRRVNS